ncbi:MAG: two-component regulator propeller domain-containing protein [Pseudomonadota bacterium]
MVRLLIFVVFFAELAFVCAPFRAVAENSGSPIRRESFALRKFDGIELPQSTVHAVHVDRHGDLWVGTREGLVQYGYGSQTLYAQTRDGQTGLPSGVVNVLLETDDALWVGTSRGVSAITDDGPRVVLQSPADRNVRLDIVELVEFDGAVIAVSSEGELHRLSLDGGVPLRESAKYTHLPTLAGSTAITAVAYGKRLFVGTGSFGILELNVSQDRFHVQRIFANDDAVVAMSVAGDQLVYLERNHGLAGIDLGPGLESMPSESMIAPKNMSLPNSSLAWTSRDDLGERDDADSGSEINQTYFRAMDLGPTSTTWFGAGASVVRLQAGREDVVYLPEPGNSVSSVTVDRVGNVWIGTYFGLYYAIDTDFQALRTPAVSGSGTISSLAEADGKLYVGGQGLWSGEPGQQVLHELRTATGDPIPGLRTGPSSPLNEAVSALSVDEDLLIAGYFAGGFDLIDLRSWTVTPISSMAGESLESVGVSALHRIGEDRWISTLYRLGLVEITLKRTAERIEWSAKTLLRKDDLIGIHALNGDRYLIVGQQHLLIADYSNATPGQSGPTFLEFSQQPPGIVFAVADDGRGGVFMGIEGNGVMQLRKSALDDQNMDLLPVPIVDEHLGDRTVWHLQRSVDNELWATSNNGVYVFDLDADALLSHVTYAHGLPANEFEYGPDASLQLSSGERLFVSPAGVVQFDKPVKRLREPYGLILPEVTVDQSSVLERLELGETSRIELPFTAVSDGVLQLKYGFYDHVRAIDASYVLQLGSREQWVPLTGSTVSITGENEWGITRVKVAMRNSLGAIVSKPLVLDIDVAAPWYMFWKIDSRIALPLALAVGLLIWGVQYRAELLRMAAVAEAERRRELMEAEMRGRLSEKEILLREIHHRVGNILSSFASNVRVMQRSAQSDETRHTLDQLNARLKVQSAVHNLLQRSDSTAINVGKMLRQITAGVRDLFASQENVRVHVYFEDVFMTYSKAQYLGLIVNELLTNSYKHHHAQASPLGVSIDLRGLNSEAADYRGPEHSGVRFSYSDDGVGITTAEIEQALKRSPMVGITGGLRQVVALARELKGDPSISTGISLGRDDDRSGMTFCFTIPARLIQSPPNDEVDDQTDWADTSTDAIRGSADQRGSRSATGN